ncbi:MAG: hypothetical protein ACTSWQ_07300 [Candidatus Thorarchaeota archaeon]
MTKQNRDRESYLSEFGVAGFLALNIDYAIGEKDMKKEWKDEISNNLREVYFDYMTEATGMDIAGVANMIELTANDTYAEEFCNDTILPICDALALTAPHFHSIQSTKEDYAGVEEQAPDYAGVEELFSQALRVHSVVKKTNSDNQRKRGSARHLTVAKRKKRIIAEVLAFAEMGFRLKVGLYSSEPLPSNEMEILKSFGEFLNLKEGDRFEDA